MECGPELKRSTDDGKTWQGVPRPHSFNEWARNVGADGTLFLAIQRDNPPYYDNQLVKVDPATGTMSGFDLSVEPAAVASDRNGRPWVAWCSYPDPNLQVKVSGIHIARVANDGTLSDQASTIVDQGTCFLSIDTDREGSLYLTNETYAPNGPSRPFLTYFAAQGSQLAVRQPPVLYDRNGLTVTTAGFSVDGGPTLAATPRSWGSGFFAFDGYESSGDMVLQEVQPGRIALRLPRIPKARVTATAQGLFADGDSVFAYIKTPPAAPAGDPVPADSQAMVDEANRLRSELGLDPLISDASIAQAARNHSRYWTLNDPTGLGLGVHKETPGKPGFTGAGPSDRCLYAGYANGCGEVMYGRQDPVAAVRGWIATAFHRSWFFNPGISRVGGAKFSDGPVVMNGSTEGFLGRPFGYPVGDYALDLGFSGERPDPAEELCPGKISEPYGAAITVALPTLPPGTTTASPFTVEEWKVTGPAGPVKGCGGGTIFVPDDALKPGSDYQVTIEWANPAQPSYSWTFHTAGTAPKGSTRRKRSEPRLQAVKNKTQLKITIRPNLGAKKQWPFRLQRRTGEGHWKTVKHKKWTTRGTKHVRRVDRKNGRYRVRSLPAHGYLGSKSNIVRLRD